MASWSRAAGVALLGVFVVGVISLAVFLGPMKEDKTVDLTNDGPVPNRAIPAIDAAASSRTETATFALG